MTAWHPAEMARITETNENPNTPTCCHGTLIQFFVREGSLHISTYQRSADVLLGVPHNFIAYWALLLYFAHHSSLKVGSLRWIFGDLHLYQHPSHQQVAEQLLTCTLDLDKSVKLCYNPSVENKDVPEFKAGDFVLVGNVPTPQVHTRPQLL
jgi:thymidylate synthase